VDPVDPVSPVEPVKPVIPVAPVAPIGPVKITFVLLDQQTGVMRLDEFHVTEKPDGVIPTTVTYPDPDERVSVHCNGLY
jgi:hypothetical protein